MPYLILHHTAQGPVGRTSRSFWNTQSLQSAPADSLDTQKTKSVLDLMVSKTQHSRISVTSVCLKVLPWCLLCSARLLQAAPGCANTPCSLDARIANTPTVGDVSGLVQIERCSRLPTNSLCWNTSLSNILSTSAWMSLISGLLGTILVLPSLSLSIAVHIGSLWHVALVRSTAWCSSGCWV